MAKDSHPLKTTTKHTRGKSTTTINQLIAVKQEASDQYQRAARAEANYRARKQTASARTALKESKTHFKEGFKHLRDGFKGLFAVVSAMPSFMAEKREAWRVKSEEKKRVRFEAKRKKLEAELARSSFKAETGEDEGGAGSA
ncbi:hypothetical protein F5Y16DRAFT_420305 [Xylariaceae sp. FL0255]|nr:hypothetical protein F5Y16DRAFT_420305 [Xylariaceae sp. FL0255]